MTLLDNYLGLADRAHKVNIKNGFWENPNSHETSLMLVISELAEAMEADRSDMVPVFYLDTQADVVAEEDTLIDPLNIRRDKFGAPVKPEGVAVELGDAMIRCLDLIAAEKDSQFSIVDAYIVDKYLESKGLIQGDSIADKLFELTKAVTKIRNDSLKATELAALVMQMDKVMKSMDLGQRTPIEICAEKVAYNSTRGYKHGGRNY